MTIKGEKPTDQRSIEVGVKTSQHERAIDFPRLKRRQPSGSAICNQPGFPFDFYCEPFCWTAPQGEVAAPSAVVGLPSVPTPPEYHAKRCGHPQGRSEAEQACRASSTYTLRIERTICPTIQINVSSAADRRSYLVPTNLTIKEADIQPNWSRDFTILGRHTLEQLNDTILHILGWDRDHLYEFHIADRVYAHLIFLEENDLFVEAEKPCVS